MPEQAPEYHLRLVIEMVQGIMSYPIAMIPYANMAPYGQLDMPDGCVGVPCVPRECMQALMGGRVIAGAMPVVGLSELGDVVEVVGRFGIAAKEESMSVLFFSDRPFADMRIPAKIRVTTESASGVRLLYLLFGYRQGFKKVPLLAGENEVPNGELVIGDAALIRMLAWRNRNTGKGLTTPDYEYVTDLASEWYAFHKLPFVFARWVIRKDASSEARKKIETWLDEFRSQEEELVKRSALKAAQELKVAEEDIKYYFQIIRRTLEDEDIAGQERFLKEMQKHSREPLFRMAV
jgi:chorismate dehydratase